MASVKVKVEFYVQAEDEDEAERVVQAVLDNLENEDVSGAIIS